MNLHLPRWAAAIAVCAALACASAALPGAPAQALLKPLPLTIAIVWIATSARLASASGQFDPKAQGLLLLALVGSLAGDLFLLREDWFVPGLASFLVAHLAYIALFARGQRWLAWRGALAATLALGGAMYALLWQAHLPAPLRLPVAVYVTVIALMAAQALSRARERGDRASRAVALGACIFLCSDAILATNRFVAPLPLAQLWVLLTYYGAQLLIACGMVAGAGAIAPQPRPPQAIG